MPLGGAKGKRLKELLSPILKNTVVQVFFSLAKGYLAFNPIKITCPKQER